MRIMFDTNAFDKMQSSSEDIERIVANDENEYFITSIQIEEINNIPDARKEQRAKNLLVLCKIGAQLVYVPAVLGHARLGWCVISSEDDIYNDLLKPTRSNVNDAMIGSAAKREQCTIVTDDIDFAKRLQKHNISTMTYETFIHNL